MNSSIIAIEDAVYRQQNNLWRLTMATIVDVAKLANVSIATVSRVLNSDFMVSPEKKQQVLSAIEQLHYEPNRQTKSPENKVIICVVSVFVENLLFSLRQAALEYGYTLTLYICTDEKNENDLTVFIKSFSKKSLAGILFFEYSPVSRPLLDLVDTLPGVLLYDNTSQANGFCSVSFNERQMAYDLTCALLKKGCKNPLLICPTSARSNLFPYNTRLRIRGFRDALEDNGLTFDENQLLKKDVTIEEGIQLAHELSDTGYEADGLLFMCTPTMIGCYYELLRTSSKPGEILFASFDTEEIIDTFHIPVTRVIPDFCSLGQEAIRTLDGLITKELTKDRKIYLNHSIIES